MVEAASTTPQQRRRRELSLWPLALIPVVGALLIVGVLVVGTHAVSGSDPEQRLLDSLQHDGRAVTPPGMHEVALHRHPCGDPLPSGLINVTRDLSLGTHADWTKARSALVTAYLRVGWHRDPSDPASLERGDRSLLVGPTDTWTETNDTLRVQIADDSSLC